MTASLRHMVIQFQLMNLFSLNVDQENTFMGFHVRGYYIKPIRVMKEPAVRVGHLVPIEARELLCVVWIVCNSVNNCIGFVSINWPWQMLKLVIT